MTTQSLLELVEALAHATDPLTGECYDQTESCLNDPEVRRLLLSLLRQLRLPAEPEVLDIPDAIIATACRDLRSLSYEPTVMQLVKVLIGSRSIVDRNLKGLPCYCLYRGVYTRQRIHAHLQAFQKRYPDLLGEQPGPRQKTADEPWRDIPFFDGETFDKLEEEKATELRAAVTDLGLRKATDRLPEYMVRARTNVPRAYEPWTRDEQALLIEAMCYTNDADKLAGVFGRSASSLTNMGKRLIYDSQRRREVA